jgi:hypothetical protein
VSLVVELVIAILLPTAAGYAILGAFRGSRWFAERHRRRAFAAPAESTERLTATLRRLRVELESTETRHGISAKNHRIRAVRGAYVDALCTACLRFEVSPPPGGERARLADIYRAEAALRQRGLDVRETAAR